MAHGSTAAWVGLLFVASAASATTVGPVSARPVAGRALEVNIPFALDAPADRACASANVRYGNGLVPRSIVDVQGRGVKRNLLVTSNANVHGPTVTLDVRLGCGARAVTRRFVLPTSTAAAKGPSLLRTMARPPAADNPPAVRPKPLAQAVPAEPLFPPPDPDIARRQMDAPKADDALQEELRQARAEATAATAQLDGVRRELAAVLDVVRRTSQTLIDADHQVRDAREEAARMRRLLNWIGAGLGLGAAGLAWLEFQRLASRRRPPRQAAPQEPEMLSGIEQVA